MSSQVIVDYLTKQIFIEKNIVTYRSLSRDLRIHVNVAKNELATYHAVAAYQSQTCFATYLICGEVFTSQTRRSRKDTEDIDMEDVIDEDLEYDSDEGDEVSKTSFMLVNERDFESARSQFIRIDSIHIYSLAPAHIHDAGLLCAPTEIVRTIDGKVGSAIASIVGKIVGANIQLEPTKTAQPAAGPSRRRPQNNAASSKSAALAPVEKSTGNTDVTKEKSKIVTEKAKEKPKPTGKLDFSKAKAKETKDGLKADQNKKESYQTAAAPTKLHPEEQKGKDGPQKVEDTPKEVKRGTKRKNLKVLMSESEDDGPSIPKPRSSSQSKGSIRLKKRTVLSDDDDDDSSPHPRMSRMSIKRQDSDAEQNLKAMMDIDDDEVIRVNRENTMPMKEEEEESSEDAEAVEMEDSIAPKPKPKKRREKKVAPVGSNGLKKKRVVKSRMTTDAKGYMVTEDYSSYESVDEEEPKPAARAKAKVKANPPIKMKKEDEEKDDNGSSSAAPKLKPAKRALSDSAAQSAGTKTTQTRKSGAKRQGPLTNFFGASTKAKG